LKSREATVPVDLEIYKRVSQLERDI
jgi:hypothetical protein